MMAGKRFPSLFHIGSVYAEKSTVFGFILGVIGHYGGR